MISQAIWGAMQDYGRIKWKRAILDLEKALDVAYQDILNEFDSIWGGGGQKALLWPGTA